MDHVTNLGLHRKLLLQHLSSLDNELVAEPTLDLKGSLAAGLMPLLIKRLHQCWTDIALEYAHLDSPLGVNGGITIWLVIVLQTVIMISVEWITNT